MFNLIKLINQPKTNLSIDENKLPEFDCINNVIIKPSKIN